MKNVNISKFSEQVYKLTKKIPKGKVVTYGQIAKALGNYKAFRAVGNTLHKNPFAPKVPCHRVVNQEGMLAKNFGNGGAKSQQKILESEGIIFHTQGRVDLHKYQYTFEE